MIESVVEYNECEKSYYRNSEIIDVQGKTDFLM
jgi:hypothetical protein